MEMSLTVVCVVVLQGKIGSVGFQGVMGFPGPQVILFLQTIVAATYFIIRSIIVRPHGTLIVVTL